jgi:predicted Zn-dependent protease
MRSRIAPLTAAFLALAAVVGLAGGGAQAVGSSSSPSQAKSSEYQQARKLIDAGDYAAALPLLRQGVAREPKNAYNELGFTQRKLGDRAGALAQYQKALALEPQHLGANEYLGELYLEMGDLARARERLRALDRACFFGCEEYDELEAAIADYEARAGS